MGTAGTGAMTIFERWLQFLAVNPGLLDPFPPESSVYRWFLGSYGNASFWHAMCH